MDPKLAKLIDDARNMVVTPEDQEAQRRSFAYGNVALDVPSVTREDVDRAAERMKLCKDCSKDPSVCEDMGCSCSCHNVPSTVTTLPAPPADGQDSLQEAKLKRLEAHEPELRMYLMAAACQIDALTGMTGTGLWGLAIRGDDKSKAEADRLKNQADLVSGDIRALLLRTVVEEAEGLKVGQWVKNDHGTYKIETISTETAAGVWISGAGPNGTLGCYLPSCRLATKEEADTAALEMAKRKR